MPPPTWSQPSTLAKLDPRCTLNLRGFDRRGAAAALCQVTADAFQVHGVFRDMADFAVLKIWDADNFFEHYTLRYLPDFDFTGVVLTFDLHYAGLQPIDSPKFNWIDWATLDCVRADGSTAQVKLWDFATLQAGAFAAAQATVTVVDNGLQAFDRVTLWLNNIAFDYIVPNPATGVTAATIAAALRDQINTANWPALSPTLGLIATSSGAALTVTAARWGTVNTAGTAVTWTGGEKFTAIPAGSTIWINGTAYTVDSVVSATALTLTASAGTQTGVRYLAQRGGRDGNMLTLYGLWKNANLTFDAAEYALAGGSSDCTWRVSIDFTARGVDQLREAWLTFAPALANGAAYADTEWTATFTNWGCTDPNGKLPLQVAGPGSVRIGSRDRWAKFTGAGWAEQDANNLWRGFARVSNTTGDQVRVRYHCQHTHDLWLGTALYKDKGIVQVSLDGDTPTPLDCYLDAEPPVMTRRRVRAAVAAGQHELLVTVTGTKHADSLNTWFTFDYLEAAVAADPPAPATVYTNVSAALDYGTDHTYKLPPGRIVAMLDRMGLHGPMNEYVSVFWWNQRQRVGGVWKTLTVQFGGTWVDGDAAFVQIGAFTMGKSVFPADTIGTIAAHFAHFINGTLVAMWAETTGTAGELRIHVRTPVWGDTHSVSKVSAAGTMATSGDLAVGTEGTWVVDDAATPVLNVAARRWHEDLYHQVAAKGWQIVSAFSMELVNPPEGPGAVWAARYADGAIVETDTGFGGLRTTHCSFTAPVLAYQKQAFLEAAALMDAAGLTPWLQFGEFLWWFFSSVARSVVGVTGNQIQTNTAHGLATGARAVIAGTRVLDGTRTITVTGADTFTVDGAVLPGAWTGAGQVRSGSMGFYDAETTAAAATALGHALTVFTCQDDDPDAFYSGADAAWLAGRIQAHADAIRTHVQASYPAAKFEWLHAYDVSHPDCYHTLDRPFPQGGRLNARVNTPAAWTAKAGSGLDRIKMEALSWGAFYRNRDRAAQAFAWPMTAPRNWPAADVVYLLPIFNGGCPWQAEYLGARNGSVPVVNFWAYDHLALMSWPLPLPKNGRGAKFI
jgi:hypothetical protein